MVDNVVDLPVITTIDLNPDRVLEAAKGKLDAVMVIGWCKEGGIFSSSSMAAEPDRLWLLEMAKLKLLQDIEED